MIFSKGVGVRGLRRKKARFRYATVVVPELQRKSAFNLSHVVNK